MKRILKSILLASTASSLITSMAVAADIPPESIAPSAPIQSAPIQAKDYDWSGAYVGINAGLGFSGEFDNTLGLDLDTDTSFIGGGVIGINSQFNKLVLGIESDLNYTRLDAASGGVTADLDFLGTVTARAGFTPADRILTYIEGGYAFGQVDASTPAGSDENIQSGFVLGGGAEFALTDHITSGIEYNYVELNEQALPGGVDAELDNHLVKFNLKFKF